MESQLEITELTIYKVDVQDIITGLRIEGFDCGSFMFLDYDKAMDFAFNLAKQYVMYHKALPDIYVDSNGMDVAKPVIKRGRLSLATMLEKLVKSERYRWFNNSGYSGWDRYSIMVYKSVLEFDKDIIHKTQFSDE